MPRRLPEAPEGGVQAALCGKHRQGRWFESTIRNVERRPNYSGHTDTDPAYQHGANDLRLARHDGAGRPELRVHAKRQ